MSEDEEPPKEIWERRKLGLELRQRYELYFVSLLFTLAGLAVQTAQRTAVDWIDRLDIVGWVCLAMAGMIGLWRISRLWRREVGVAEEAGGHPAAPLRGELVTLEAWIRGLEKVQWGLFVLGLASLMLSRGAGLLS